MKRILIIIGIGLMLAACRSEHIASCTTTITNQQRCTGTIGPVERPLKAAIGQSITGPQQVELTITAVRGTATVALTNEQGQLVGEQVAPFQPLTLTTTVDSGPLILDITSEGEARFPTNLDYTAVFTPQP